MQNLTLFNSKSSLGNFGEFLYFEYVSSLGFEIHKVGLREVDFIVHNKSKNKDYKVDVKTTLKSKSKYTGTRFHGDISYDLIVVHDGVIKIFPDINSPLSLYGASKLGSLEEKYEVWNEFKNSNTKIHSKTNEWSLGRLKIKNEIVDCFNNLGVKARVIFRGSVSRTRWNSSPDNLPGSKAVIQRFDVTVYIQLKSEADTELIHCLYVIFHDKLNEMPFLPSNNRQKNKGIEKVIDWDKFRIALPANVFYDLQAMLSSFK